MELMTIGRRQTVLDAVLLPVAVLVELIWPAILGSNFAYTGFPDPLLLLKSRAFGILVVEFGGRIVQHWFPYCI